VTGLIQQRYVKKRNTRARSRDMASLHARERMGEIDAHERARHRMHRADGM